MPKKPKSNVALAAEICRELGPDAPTRTIARRLHLLYPERFATIESARNPVRDARGAGSKNSRVAKANLVPRSKQPAGWRPKCPPSIDEPWAPVQIDGPVRVLSLSDIHSPFHCKPAVEAAVAMGKKLRPQVVVLLGDILDFYNLSRFDKDPQRVKTADEIETGVKLLRYIRESFPKARIIYKLGNHEERWQLYIWNHAPVLWGVKNMRIETALELAELGIECVGDNPIMAGKLPMLHGHELGRSTIGNPVNPARGAFLRSIHTVLVGHHHRTSTHSESDMFGKEIAVWSQGCLCGLTPKWLRVNKWNHGFPFISVGRDGEFDLQNYRISRDYKVRAA